MQTETQVQTPEAERAAQAPPDAAAEAVDALRRVHAFADLPDEQLQWFAAQSVEKRLEPGEVLFRRGDLPDWMTVYLEGEVHAQRGENSLDDYVYIARAGDPATEVTGKLPFSRMREYGATARAVTPARLLMFPVALFPEMLQRMPVLAERLVWIMSDRVRETTRADEQQERLTALGKLSAGLAHELNNPAAAAGRAAGELLDALDALRAADLNLCRHNLNAEQRAFIAAFECEAIRRAEDAEPLDAITQSDREEEIGLLLDKRGVADSWDVAPTLVESGVDAAELERLAAQVSDDALGDVLARVAAQVTTAKLVCDIRTSAARVSELVGAIKEYSYLDRAPVQEVDLHKSLDNTLVILKHKLKAKSIRVERDYDAELPRVTAHGGELNQVWTNLIDNAVDAMGEGGRLRVRTKREPTGVMVEVRDDGAGIPPDVQRRIFEPFFTTKPVGEGTGLGLDTALRIVRKHRGQIRCESKPGDTCFQVRLPVNSGG